MQRDFIDKNGFPVPLEQLCRSEPEWAASRLRREITGRERAERDVASLKRLIVGIYGMRCCLSVKSYITRNARWATEEEDAA